MDIENGHGMINQADLSEGMEIIKMMIFFKILIIILIIILMMS